MCENRRKINMKYNVTVNGKKYEVDVERVSPFHQMSREEIAGGYVAAPAPVAAPVVAAPVAAPVAQSFCAKCGNVVPAGQAFCAVCGQPVGGPVVNPAINQFNAQVQQTKKKSSLPLILGIVGGVVAFIVVLAIILGGGPKVENVILSDSSIELRVDDTYSVDCEILPVEAAAEVDVEWSSSNSSVATVSSSGTITAQGEGTCTITAEAGGVTDSVSVTVVAMAPEEAEIIGTWSAYAMMEYGEIEEVYSSVSTAYVYDDMTGKLVAGDSTLYFEWYYSYSDDGFYYYKGYLPSSGEDLPFIYMTESDLLVFDLGGDMQLLYER